MKKGPLILLGVGITAIVSILIIKPFVTSHTQNKTSDASNVDTTITIAIDDWVGYVPLCSDYMVKQLRRRSIGLDCKNDQANYEERMHNLDKGKIDFAVVEVGSYAIEGADSKYPGVTIAVLDTSKGGDAVIALKSKYPDVNALKNDDNAQIGLTLKSPSEFFMLTTGLHFGMDYLKDSTDWQVPTDGATQALEYLTSGKVDAAVMWEPNVTKALQSDKYVKLVSTEDAQNVIVDTLLVGREFSLDHPELV